MALSALCIGFFLLMMDTTIVNVAIPRIMSDLNTDLNMVNWVNSIYLLTYAVPLLLAGRLGDRVGRKPMYLAGLGVFTAASLLCALSATAGMLVAARALQGLGAATIAPQTMAFITGLFPPHKRGSALGVWAAVGGVATTIGPLLGGALVGDLGWQWIFIVNVPIGVVGLVLAALLVPGGQPGRARSIDPMGTVLSSLGLLALVFSVQNGQQYHWGRVYGRVGIPEIFILGVVLLTAFVIWQRINARDPLMPLALFGHRNFTAAAMAGMSVGFALTGLYLPLTIYFQSALGYSPLGSGLIMVPIAISAAIVGPFGGWLSDRVNGKYVVLTGFLVFAAGIGIIASTARLGIGPWVLVLALTVCGMGTGSIFSPMANVAMGDVPQAMLGAAAGVYNATRQVGSVIGSAAVGALLQARLAVAAPSTPSAGRLTEAVSETLSLPVAVLLLGVLACLAMTGRERTSRSEQGGTHRHTEYDARAADERVP